MAAEVFLHNVLPGGLTVTRALVEALTIIFNPLSYRLVNAYHWYTWCLCVFRARDGIRTGFPSASQSAHFLTFHSYSQILMYPFGHQVRTYSNDLNDLRSTALSASSQLHRMFGTHYKVGTGADTLYPASGGSEDWAKGKAHVKYSYLFELRPEEQVWDGFLLSENQIMPTARETWEAVKVIASQTLAIPTVARAPQRRPHVS
ncbi:hypothetical protein COOONC_19039 [Cooperia oncophora]